MGRQPPDRGRSGAEAARRALLAWVLYDAATVVFSLNITSIAFPLWVVKDAGGSDADVGVALGAGMALVLLLAPLVGGVCDRTGRRVRLLTVCSLLCGALTLGLGHGGLSASLVLFALVVGAFGCALVCYDALLPLVSTPETRGRVSGYGIGAGFAGALAGVLLGLLVIALGGGRPLVFDLTALIFLLGLIPAVRWIREPVGTHASIRVALREAAADVRRMPARARAWPGMGRFLLGRVFYTDAGNTIFAFMAVYAAKEVGFSDVRTQVVLLSGILAGPVGALGAGAAADRHGPKRTLDALLVLWIVMLSLCAAIPAFGLPDALFWLVAPMGGAAIGGTSATDRAMVLRLTPPDRAGEGFGLFATVGRFSAIAGPLIWSAEADWLGWGRPAAVATLAGMVVVALVIFRPLDDRQRAWAPEPMPAD